MSRHFWRQIGLAMVIVAGQLIPANAVVAVDDVILPDLGMLPPKDFSIQSRPRGQRWLRFDSVVVNAGPGRFDVYGGQSAGPGDRPVTQRLQLATGGWTEQPTTAGMFYAGDGHAHWHVRDLQEWTIRYYTDGQPGEIFNWGAKTGFCFWDNFPHGTPGPKVYSGTTACHERNDGTIPMGLAVDWGDEYPSTISGQYIDISGMPNGTYLVTLKADQRNDFVEVSDTNNEAWALIKISRKAVQVLDTGTQLPPPQSP